MGNVAVYKKGTTNFFSQGLGLLSDVVSSNLTQTVSSTGNVGQKLEVEYPIDGYLVSELVEGAILRISVSTNKSDYGVFEIVDTLKDDSGTITVYGDPYYNRILRMSFDNGGVFTKFSSVQSALDAAKQNITGFPADFNLISNLNTSVDLSENSYDTFGTFLEALNSAAHGNIKYSLNSIQIYSAIGKDITDITLRDDMNTSSVKITTDFSGIINKVIPVLPVLDKDGNATDKTKVGTIVTSKYSNQFLDYWAGKVIQFDTQDLANTYFNRTKSDRPVQTVDVDPIGLDDDFSTINIFDTIELYSTRLDYTDKLRVSERVFDTLSENVTSFKLGSSSVNIFNQINEQNDEIFNNVVKLTNAAISANGKGIDYFGQAKPSSPKEGDTWFWDDGTDFGIKQYTNGEWVDLVSSNTADKIEAGVTEAVSQAKAHVDEVKQVLSTDIETAKSQAASLANAAEENAKSEATSLFSRAQNALSDAKTDLTKSISSEASKAVAAANSQAQNYVNEAKKDINDTINALSVGGRNLYLNSRGLADWYGPENNVTATVEPFDSTTNMWHIVAAQGSGNPVGIWLFKYGNGKLPDNSDWSYSADVKGTGKAVTFGIERASNTPVKGNIGSTWSRISQTGHINEGNKSIVMYFDTTDSPLDVYIKLPKLETGNVPTDWTPAPEDVVLDYTTKDNKIKETITQYKENINGHVSKLQTDVTTALGQIETKISQTDYDKKTGELLQNINEAKDTADRSAQTIAEIKEADGKQDARMSEIENTASEIKSTVSDLSTAQDKQSGYISTLQQTAKGFESTVTKVDNLSIGGRNYFIMNNAVSGYLGSDGIVVYVTQVSADMTSDFIAVSPNETWQITSWPAPTMFGSVIYAYYDSNKSFITGSQLVTWIPDTKPSTISITIPHGVAYIRVSNQHMNSNQGAKVKVEKGTKPTDWTPAPEDISSTISKVKQTADEASTAVSKLTSVDGVITKAQADIKANADAITQKVSQTVYDKKNGELSEKINKAKDTADESLRTIGEYKTSNDERVSEAESKIKRTTEAITETVSKKDYDKKTGELTHDLSELKHTADGFEETVTKVKNLAVGGRNLYLNSMGLADGYGIHGNVRVTVEPFDSTTNMWHIVAEQGAGTEIGIYFWDYGNGKLPDNSDWSYSADIKGTGKVLRFDIEGTPVNTPVKGNIGSKWSRISQTGHINEESKTLVMYFDTTDSPLDVYIKLPKLETGNIATDWTPAPEDVQSDISQVKHTADGISNFVRDSSGNISSDFQTALSKTSIITGSTLASSIQMQTSSQISSAITDNNGKIISLINQDSSGVQIAGKNLAITADTTVDGNFWAKQVNAVKVNATNITVGTLNGNQVNITNINANNIVSGAISGANLNINLNTGQVQFQKGRIFSSDYKIDVNMDEKYISTADSDTRVLLKGGQMQFIQPSILDLQSSPYFQITNNGGGSAIARGASLIGRDNITIANRANDLNVFDNPFSKETFSGLYTGYDGRRWSATKVGGADRGVLISGGAETTWNYINASPYIYVGASNPNGTSGYGNRVHIHAEFLHAQTVYQQTSSGGANVYVASDGALVKSSSATKYKTNIEHETDSIQGDQLLTIDPATWNDKFEAEQLERYHETGIEPERQINMEDKRYYGIIAEDLVKAGLEELVTRNEETDEVEGVEYSKIGVALIPIVRDLRSRLNEQYVEIERLKDKIK